MVCLSTKKLQLIIIIKIEEFKHARMHLLMSAVAYAIDLRPYYSRESVHHKHMFQKDA